MQCRNGCRNAQRSQFTSTVSFRIKRTWRLLPILNVHRELHVGSRRGKRMSPRQAARTMPPTPHRPSRTVNQSRSRQSRRPFRCSKRQSIARGAKGNQSQKREKGSKTLLISPYSDGYVCMHFTNSGNKCRMMGPVGACHCKPRPTPSPAHLAVCSAFFSPCHGPTGNARPSHPAATNPRGPSASPGRKSTSGVRWQSSLLTLRVSAFRQGLWTVYPLTAVRCVVAAVTRM